MEPPSQAEFSAIALRTLPVNKAIGSHTAGADGNVTDLTLPGGFAAFLAGLGVYYADGRPTRDEISEKNYSRADVDQLPDENMEHPRRYASRAGRWPNTEAASQAERIFVLKHHARAINQEVLAHLRPRVQTFATETCWLWPNDVGRWMS
jgi:hypothetical protein